MSVPIARCTSGDGATHLKPRCLTWIVGGKVSVVATADRVNPRTCNKCFDADANVPLRQSGRSGTPSIRIRVGKRIISSVSVSIPILWLHYITLKNPRSLVSVPTPVFVENNILRVHTCEPSLRRRVVSGEEVVQPRLHIPFFEGDLLAHAVAACIPLRG